MSKKYFKIFDSCKIIEGYSRYLIYDLPRKKYYSCSKYLTIFLQKIAGEAQGGPAFNESDQQLIDFFLEKEIMFAVDEVLLPNFPDSSTDWYYPAAITNAVITIKETCTIDFNHLALRLDEVLCRDLVFVFENYVPPIEMLSAMFESFDGRATRIKN